MPVQADHLPELSVLFGMVMTVMGRAVGTIRIS